VAAPRQGRLPLDRKLATPLAHKLIAALCLIMPVIEALCASILVPHDHRHINHVGEHHRTDESGRFGLTSR
jgi:hypothetical protein